MKSNTIIDVKKIPKNPILFGIFISSHYKKWSLTALFFVFIATAVSRYTVVILSNLTNALSATPFVLNAVWIWAIAYPVLFFVGENMWRASGFVGMSWFMNFRFAGYQSLYEYLTFHSKDYFNSRFAGSLSNKITHAVDGTQALLENILWQFIPLVLGLIWFTGFAFVSDYRLGLIIGIWSVLFLAANVWFAKTLQPHSFKSAKAGSTLKGRIVDSLSNISLVHEYAFITGEQEYIKNFVKKDRDAGLALWRLSEWMLVANGTMIFLFMAIIIGTSLILFQYKIVNAGVVIMVIAIALKLSDQLLFLGQQLRDAIRYYGEAKEGLSEILKEHLIIDAKHAVDLRLEKGTINLDAV
ncbi:MAG TPA: ABC transporter transmembrane domain-containing protein, partial [Methylomirabilota bacterium]|nr:ABC transporter transmembrane domain-containing protein [Methylomirabilota bacterium]